MKALFLFAFCALLWNRSLQLPLTDAAGKTLVGTEVVVCKQLDRQELPAALFERLDANQDGVVNEEEMKALWRRRQ